MSIMQLVLVLVGCGLLAAAFQAIPILQPFRWIAFVVICLVAAAFCFQASGLHLR